jgi:nicotinamidase-related amidase
VKATGRKTLIIAGTITSVCMAFPSISAVADGYKVFVVIDASGTYSKMAQEITLARVVQAGVYRWIRRLALRSSEPGTAEMR